MRVKRVGASVCYVPPSNQSSRRGYIYVFGGRTDDAVKTKLCERFDIENNKWEMIAKMNNGKARSACCYDQNNNNIYIFFGTDSNNQNNCTVEKYNVNTNTWTLIEISNFLPGISNIKH